jgi:hypothetical protein
MRMLSRHFQAILVAAVCMGVCACSTDTSSASGRPSPPVAETILTFIAADGERLQGDGGLSISPVGFSVESAAAGGGAALSLFAGRAGRQWRADVGLSLASLRNGEATIRLKIGRIEADSGRLFEPSSSSEPSITAHSGVMHVRFKVGRQIEGDIDSDIPALNGTFAGTVKLGCETLAGPINDGRGTVSAPDGGIAYQVDVDPNFTSDFCRPFQGLR